MIAFNLNSWNEVKKVKTVERQYYGDIIQELNEDLFEIKENRAFNNYFLPKYKLAKEIILTDYNMMKVDSLGKISLQLMF